ncbi:GMC oxidoreductase [Spongisporangium articulatum]
MTTRALVIGSGVGGAITAFRLSQAGVQTLVLERGRRWAVTPRGNTFASTERLDGRALYLEPRAGRHGRMKGRTNLGVVEIVPGDGLPVVRGAGVGGGTLVYAGATIRPGEAVFRRILPTVGWESMDAEYYPRAARRLRATPLPQDLLNHPHWTGVREFLAMGRAAGLRTELVRQTVDWDVVRQELAGTRVPALSAGQYLLGVNSGARNSVDRTYLADAERTGLVTVAPLHRVTGLTFDAARRRYRVAVERLDEHGAVAEYLTVTAGSVFCAAGSVGTAQLLVAARQTGALPELNEHVGRHWGGNGDAGWFYLNVPGAGGGRQGGGISAAVRDESDPAAPVTLEQAGVPVPLKTHAMPVLGMGFCAPAGEFRFHPATGAVRPTWPAAVEPTDAAGLRRMALTLRAGSHSTRPGPLAPLEGALARLAGDVGRLTDRLGLSPSQNGVLRALLGIPRGGVDATSVRFTGHPLGGAVLDAACDNHGRLRGYPGLYVMDAALIPASTGGVNPTWTIAALVERCLDTVLREDVGRLV